MMLKNWLIALGYFFGIFFVGTLFVTIIDYFNLFSTSVVSVLKLIIPIVSIVVSGYYMGSHSNEKGYLGGIKIGIFVIAIFMLIVFLVDKISVKCFLYYLILLLVSILSSMLGINYKKN